jgi:hypothetical protein
MYASFVDGITITNGNVVIRRATVAPDSIFNTRRSGPEISSTRLTVGRGLGVTARTESLRISSSLRSRTPSIRRRGSEEFGELMLIEKPEDITEESDDHSYVEKWSRFSEKVPPPEYDIVPDAATDVKKS